MRIKIHKEEGLSIIKLIGRYDIEEVYDFDILFQNQIDMNVSVIALNLAELRYIDSSGIGSLIRSKNTAMKNGIEFLCYNLHKDIVYTFQLSKIDQFLTILSEDEFLNKYVTIFDVG